MRHRGAPGVPPGTLSVDPEAHRSRATAFAFGPGGFDEHRDVTLEALDGLLERWPVTWIDVDGLGDETLIRAIGERFRLHPLALEDVVHTHQRAKFEEYEHHFYFVLRTADWVDGHLVTEQVSLFAGRGFVVTFQERPGDCFDAIRDRIRTCRGRVRRLGADYLAYALIDSLVDHYFPLLEHYGERIEELEEQVFAAPRDEMVGEIHELRHDLLSLRRMIWPLRDAINVMHREELDFISADTRVYLRDCYDHTVQLIDTLETYRELGANLLEVYLSTVDNRLNETMRFLTLIATTFMPLSFIAGVYGMNFDRSASPWNMPELGWRYGYPMALTAMALTAVAMLAFFWRRGWIGRSMRRRIAAARARLRASPGPPGPPAPL